MQEILLQYSSRSLSVPLIIECYIEAGGVGEGVLHKIKNGESTMKGLMRQSCMEEARMIEER